jgi:NAD(P)-dependent dehydrogenase (short-subunit alcohol dehydrogenase family)
MTTDIMNGGGRVALVTGANGGIGRALTATLIAQAVSVAAVDADAAVNELASWSTNSATVLPIGADIRDAEQCIAAVRTTTDRFGDIDILVNNAGVMHFADFADYTLADWDLQFDVNVRAAFVFCRAIVPAMAARGHGNVVNVASIWATRGGPRRTAYIAAKHALVGLTRALAAEYLTSGVRINAVSPGPVRTPMTAPLGGDQSQWMDPQQIADAICYLCSDAASGTIGANIEVLGQGRPAGL